jgi:asparagine synthase (glutamine-hydrolysing)
MLFGVVDLRDAHHAQSAIDEIACRFGGPSAVVARHCCVIAGWGPSARVRIDRDEGCAIDGRVDAMPLGDTSDDRRRLLNTRGDFALVAARADGLLALSGQAGGYRPLYWANVGPHRAVVSTRMEAIVRLLGGQPRLDVDFLASRLSMLATFSGRPIRCATPFSDIRRIPVGEAALLRPGAEPQSFVLPSSTHEPFSGSDRDCAAYVKDAWRAAVRRAMVQASEIGVAAGGGLDSSALLGTACDLAREGNVRTGIHVFSWDYASSTGDDRPFLRTLTEHLGLEPHRVRPHEASCCVSRAFVLDAMPTHAPSAALSMALFRAAKRSGVDVLLTGMCGDNVLDGQPRVFARLLKEGRVIEAFGGAMRVRGPYGGRPLQKLRQYVFWPIIREFVPGRVRRARWRRTSRRLVPWAGPRLRAHLDAVSPAIDPGIDASPAARYAAMAYSPFVVELGIIRGQYEAVTDCYERDPFLDDEFLRAIARIPAHAFFYGGYFRGLLREAVRGSIPDSVRMRESKALLEPALEDMIRAAGGVEALGDISDVRMLADLGLVEPTTFRKSLESFAVHPADGDWWSVWPALALEGFLRRWEAGELLS